MRLCSSFLSSRTEVKRTVKSCPFLKSFFPHLAIYDVVEEKADSEPEFQYIPEKCPQDPTQIDQHALRDSMVTLKEGLSSGAILAQFDVRGTTTVFNDIFICKHVTVCCFVFLQQLYRKRPGMTMLCAKLPQNVSKNRYRDISPCTASQVSTSMNIFSAPLTCSPSPLPPEGNFLCMCSLSTSLCLPLQMMPHGSFWKAQMTTSMQITSMWVSTPCVVPFI